MSRFAILAFMTLFAVAPPGQPAARAPCDGPDADPWVREFRDRVVSYDGLAHHAIERYGEPITCDGAVTVEFDGVRFGTLTLEFSGGFVLHVETMPPESSVTSLRATAGFADEAETREALETYARQIGLAIDWTAPELTTEGSEVVHQFRDPDPGLNASASLVFSEGRLVAIRIGMAL